MTKDQDAKEYDVIVVGLGPAGSNAAYHLGRAGLKVLAIERKKMPRQKLCAGGIPSKVFPLLDFDFSATIQQEIEWAAVCFRQEYAVETPREEKIGYVVDRAHFDHLLALRAATAGVQILEDETVRGISEEGLTIEVRTDHSVYRSRALVGAEGAQGVVGRYLGRSPKSVVIGLELLVSDDYELIRNHIQSRKLAFYFGYLPDGYGWIFPRQEDASVGIGVTMKYAQRARALFSDFVNSIGLPRELAAKAKGHPIPLFSPFDRGPICRKNILLTGDAASFVDPITGEGIYYALKSGELAARALIESMPEGRKAAPGYKAAVERAFLGELRAAWKISLPLYAFPGAGFDLFRTSERIRKLHFDVIAGRASYTDLVKEVPRAGLLLVKSFFSRKS